MPARAPLLVLAISAVAAAQPATPAPEAPADAQTDPAPLREPKAITPSVERAGNLLSNPSFELGREPWTSMVRPEQPRWADFELTNIVSTSGQWSALLPVRSEGYTLDTRVYGVMQELDAKALALDALPERIGGRYYVDAWERGASRQYLQAVVIVMADDPAAVFNNHPNAAKPKSLQVAFVLAGIDRPPFSIGNRKFIFRGPVEPVQHEWVEFEFDLRQEFVKAWGVDPKGFDRLRVFYECRFDKREPGMPEVVADVMYDDVFLGPALTPEAGDDASEKPSEP